MEENEGGPVVTASESTVSVSVASAGETPVDASKNCEGCEGQSGYSFRGGGGGCDRDGEDVMVEVLGSDVYVDGVGSEEGVARDLSEDRGRLSDVGLDLERRASSADERGDRGSGGEVQNLGRESGPVDPLAVAGSSENALASGIADKDLVMASEKESVDGGSDANSGLGDRETNGVEGSSDDVRYPVDQVLCVDKVAERVNDNYSERGSVEEREGTGGKPIDVRVDAASDLEPQKIGVSEDGVENPAAGKIGECSSKTIKSSNVPAQVFVEESLMAVSEENVNTKDEVSGSDALDRNLACLEKDLISAIDVVHQPTESDVHGSSESGTKEIQVAEVGAGVVMGNEEVVHFSTKVAESDAHDGNLKRPSEDQLLNAEIPQKSTENCGNGCAGSESNSIPTEVAESSPPAKEDKVVSTPNVEVVDFNGTVLLSASEQNFCSEKDQSVQAEPVGDGSDCADSQLSIQRDQIPEGNSVPLDDKASVPTDGSSENLAGSERSQKSEVDTQNGRLQMACSISSHSESSAEQIRIADTRGIPVVDNKNALNSKLEVHCVNAVQVGENEQSMEIKTEPQAIVDNSTSDMETSNMQAQAADHEKLVAVDDKKALDSKVEVPSVDALDENSCFPEKDLEKKANIFTKAIEKDCFVDAGPCSSFSQILVDKEDIRVKNNQEFSESQVEDSGIDKLGVNICSQEDEQSNAMAVDGIPEKVDGVHPNLVPSPKQAIIGIQAESPIVDNRKPSDSNLTVVRNYEAELKVDTMDARTDMGQRVCVDANSNEEISDPKVEFLGSSGVDKNVSLSEKDSMVRIEEMVESLENDSTMIAEPSVAVGSLPLGDHTSSVSEQRWDVPPENTSIQDENQEKDAQLDQSKNPPAIEETLEQGASEISVSVVDFAVGPQTVASSAGMGNEAKRDSFSISDNVSLLQGGNQDFVAQSVDNHVHLEDGDHTKHTLESDDQVMEAKIEPNETEIVSTSVPESILPHSTYTNPITHSEGEEQSKTQDEVAKESVSSEDEPNHELSEIQGVEGKDGFPVSECQDKGEILLSSQSNLSVDQYAGAGEQIIDAEESGSLQVRREIEQSPVSEHVKTLEDSIVPQDTDVEIDFDTELFGSCGKEDLQTEEWTAGSEELRNTGEKTVGQEAEFYDQASEHFGLDAVQVVEAEPQPSGSEEKLVAQETEVEEQPTDSEQLKSTEERIVKRGALKPGISTRLHQATYELPLDSEGEFSVADLVWGKVRSHPWWPGQVFDPSDSSEKAAKYYKKDCHLVAYFGDRTFAWNDASLLKPFRTYFSQIENHSSSELFQNAVDCALDEVSRRVELGLACSCIPEETYNKIKYQIVENTGIRQESSRRGGVDQSTSVNSFEPAKLMDYINELARFPTGGGHRLELVVAKAQLLALNRFKGYNWLPEFQFCGAVEDDEAISSGKGYVKNQSSSSHKRKHNLKVSAYHRKKEGSVFDLMGGPPHSSDSEDGSEGKDSKSKKQRALSSFTDDSAEQDGRKSIVLAKVSQTASPSQRQSFKVGECISRVASQLTRSPSILKGSGDNTDFDMLDPEETGKMIVPEDSSSPDEILAQLDLAARHPTKCYGYLSNMIGFFYDYRNYIVASGRETSFGRKRKYLDSENGPPETFEFEDMNDSYWTDRIVQNGSEEQRPRRGRKRKEHQSVSVKPEGCCLYGNYEMAAGRPAHDLSPTELVLNFSEIDSVPSETNLNKIFRRFGPLREFETEVDMLTARARVVFKRCSDAEVAFTSARTFNIFGSSAVNYQLSYSPSISFKSSPLAIMEGQDDAC